MVTEAQRKSGQTLDGALRALCQLAAMTGTALNTAELGTWATGKVTPPLIAKQLVCAREGSGAPCNQHSPTVS